MIGYQCNPSNGNQVGSSSGAAATSSSMRSASSRASSPAGSYSSPSSSSAASTPDEAPHSQKQQVGQTRRETKSPPTSQLNSTSGDSSGILSSLGAKLMSVQQQVTGNTGGAGGQQSLQSPGYHSAGSSPSSSAASPVSSSSILNGSPLAGSSSGVSSAGSFLSSAGSPASSRSPVSPNLLDYYPEINQDGLSLSWFHEANNRARLSAALMTDKMLVVGDISLAEMSRYPVPIMARPPLGVSDITLDNWLQEVIHSRPHKGIKLTFTSTRTVEPAFRVLARHADQIKGPLILNADILSGTSTARGAPGAGRGGAQTAANQQPVDAWTFLMLCRTRFPKCIISIGWCPPASGTFALGPAWTPEEAPLESPQLPPDSSTPAGSLHSSADSMLELDLMSEQVAAASQLSQLQQRLQLHYGAPLGAFDGSSSQQQRHQLINHHQLASQLSQVNQSLGLSLVTNPNQQLGHHHHHHHLAHPLSHHHHHHHHHHILSSTGSLNSSSGNSSGSPSPTSPISQLMSPPQHQTAPANLSTAGVQVKQEPAVTEHLFLAAAAAAAAEKSAASSKGANAAAAALAAVVAASAANFNQQQPLNLTINETELASSASMFAHKLQSYQQLASSAASQESLQQVGGKMLYSGQNSGQHIHKKTAVGAGANPNVPSPRSSSPKQRAASQGHLLLKTTSAGQQQPAARFSNSNNQCYTREMIDKMASLVKEYNLTQPVTFPVEARRLRNSLGELQRLLYQVGSNSTLTVVAQQEDLISVDDLLTIRKAFATNQILFDLPDELAASFKQELDLM